MRNFVKLLAIGVLASFSSACSQTAAVHPKIAVQKAEPKLQTIHLYGFSRDQVALFGLGMLDLACITLETVRSDESKTVMNCLPTPEKKVFSEIGRVLLKYSIKADYRLKNDVIEIR